MESLPSFLDPNLADLDHTSWAALIKYFFHWPGFTIPILFLHSGHLAMRFPHIKI